MIIIAGKARVIIIYVSCFSPDTEKREKAKSVCFLQTDFAFSEKHGAEFSPNANSSKDHDGLPEASPKERRNEMRRTEKVEATLTPDEKEIFRTLCEEAGCTEAELIRSVLIHREISLDELGDEMQVSDKKKKALSKQQSDYKRSQSSQQIDASGEPLNGKRDSYIRVMLTASEKKAIGQRAKALGISASELVRRSAIYGKLEPFNFDIASVEKLHHELLKEGTNLNQLMYFVNTQGLPAYNEKTVFRTLEKVYRNANKVDKFIEDLEKRFHLDYVPSDYLSDEPDNKNLKNKKRTKR